MKEVSALVLINRYLHILKNAFEINIRSRGNCQSETFGLQVFVW